MHAKDQEEFVAQTYSMLGCEHEIMHEGKHADVSFVVAMLVVRFHDKMSHMQGNTQGVKRTVTL